MGHCIKTTAALSFCVWMLGTLGQEKLAVDLGENVTLSCSNISKEQTQVDWFRVENGTKARCISSMLETTKPSYCSGFKNRRFRMSTNTTEVFLTISEVNTSDSGLYYCGFFMKSNIILGETTYLSVTGDLDPTNSAVHDDSQTHNRFRWMFFVAVTLGSLCGILCLVVILLALKNNKLKKVNKEQQERANKVPLEELNYAALNVKAAKRLKTSHRQTEPNVIYSSTR